MLTHRWLGVGFCILFAAWFLSGIVMMYWRFPRVEIEERLSRASKVDASQIHIGPDTALAALHTTAKPSQIRLSVVDSRPAYHFAFGRQTKFVFADDGTAPDGVSREMALRIASDWTGLASKDASFEGLVTVDDQWTVYSSVRPYGPFWKFAWPGGQEVYVSKPSGEVVQHTTRGSRIGAYLGAIPHWLYFTPLRRDGALWSDVVIWFSGAGTVTSVLGLVAGIWLYSPSKRYRFADGPSRTPYHGIKRWHVILGLVFGAVTCTWIFSGLLSMGPFDWLTDRGHPNLAPALRSSHLDVTQFSLGSLRTGIETVRRELDVKDLELIAIAGEPHYLVTESSKKSALVQLDGRVQHALATDWLRRIVQDAISPTAIAETRIVSEYERYYLDRHHRRPLPVLYVRLNDEEQSAFYIDPKTARVVQSYGTRSRWNRWLYHGLHSFDFPWLYARRPAWDILVMALMLGGTALSITSLPIGWKVLRRRLRPLFSSNRNRPALADFDDYPSSVSTGDQA